MVFPISENFYLIWPAKKRKIRNIPIKAQALLRWAKVAIQNYKRQELGLGVKLLKVFLLLFNQRLSSINGCSPSNVVLHKRSSSTEVVSPLKVFHGKHSKQNKNMLHKVEKVYCGLFDFWTFSLFVTFLF